LVECIKFVLDETVQDLIWFGVWLGRWNEVVLEYSPNMLYHFIRKK
jgi:hypothetical protein